jgi:hypothetical protein
VRVPVPRTQALTFGEPLNASIDTPGEVSRFAFAAASGDEFVLADPTDINTNCDIVWRIRGQGEPDDGGAELYSGSACFDTDPLTIPAAGDYVVEVAGKRATTGPASVAVFPVPAPRTEPLRFGEAIDVAIETPGQRVRFTFDGTAGDEIALTDPVDSNDNCQIVWRIIGPGTDEGGEELVFEGSTCFDRDPVTLAATGTHVLEVDGNRAATGAAALRVERR